MNAETQPNQHLPDEELILLCRDYLLAMMRSASTDKVPPKEWWEQAKTALELGAEEPTIEEMTSAIAKRLKIESLTSFTANWICSHDLVIRMNFAAFRRQCRKSAVYIAGMARVQRETEREWEKSK